MTLMVSQGRHNYHYSTLWVNAASALAARTNTISRGGARAPVIRRCVSDRPEACGLCVCWQLIGLDCLMCNVGYQSKRPRFCWNGTRRNSPTVVETAFDGTAPVHL